jgi:cysteine dioxygenase
MNHPMKQDLYLPESLSSIVSQLEKLNSPDAEQLKSIVSKANVSAEDLHPFRFFDHPSEQSYGRTLIYTSKNFMILSISWAPGDFSAIHSHGDTEWGVLCFFGDCEHRLYEEKGNTLRLVKKSIIPEGSPLSPLKGTIFTQWEIIPTNPSRPCMCI